MDVDKIIFFDQAATNWNENISKLDHATIERAINLLNFKDDEVVLDIGCGTGVLFPYLRKQMVIGLDFSIKMLENIPVEYLSENVSLLCADAHSIPLESNSIDHITCFSTFPHFTFPQIIFKEVKRVLKQGGSFSIIHLSAPEIINDIHRSVGGAIENDILPDMKPLTDLVMKYFNKTICINTPCLYFLQVTKAK